MDDSLRISEDELIGVIVNFGQGSRIIETAREHGITGGTILLGKGTVHSRFLQLLSLDDIRKEIVVMVGSATVAAGAAAALDAKYSFAKPNHGIAFTIPVRAVFGLHQQSGGGREESRGENMKQYQAIITIVDEGRGELVIDAAEAAGSRGGTIINGRGSGIHETSHLFHLTIEPEKEVVLVICEAKLTEEITASIRRELDIDAPGKGILFVLDINRAYGLY